MVYGFIPVGSTPTQNAEVSFCCEFGCVCGPCILAAYVHLSGMVQYSHYWISSIYLGILCDKFLL